MIDVNVKKYNKNSGIVVSSSAHKGKTNFLIMMANQEENSLFISCEETVASLILKGLKSKNVIEMPIQSFDSIEEIWRSINTKGKYKKVFFDNIQLLVKERITEKDIQNLPSWAVISVQTKLGQYKEK